MQKQMNWIKTQLFPNLICSNFYYLLFLLERQLKRDYFKDYF